MLHWWYRNAENKYKVADGRHLENVKKIVISPQPLDKIWHDDASGTSTTCQLLTLTESENPKWPPATTEQEISAIADKPARCHVCEIFAFEL